MKRHVAFAVGGRAAGGARPDRRRRRAVDLFLVDPAAPGVPLRQQFSVASDTQYEVTFADGVVERGGPDRAAGSGWSTWQQVLEPGLVLLAAQAVGGARYALEITTQYALDRKQFDKPLGRSRRSPTTWPTP